MTSRNDSSVLLPEIKDRRSADRGASITIWRTIIQGLLTTTGSGRQRPRAEDDAYPIPSSVSSLESSVLTATKLTLSE